MQLQILLSFSLLLTSFTGLASATLSLPGINTLNPRACGGTPQECNKNNCKGINDPNGGLGMCTNVCRGSSCKSVCGTPGDCDKAGCQGLNTPGGGLGICQAGDFKGCSCKSICRDKSGSCSDKTCNGKNGFCTSGVNAGCPCDSKCGNLLAQSCSSNGCNGVNSPRFGAGVCTGTGLEGCPCITTCGAKNGPCNGNGCNGVNGRCTAGAAKGCNCN